MPEQKEALESVAVIGGRVVAQYLVDVQSRLRLFGLDGSDQGEIALPGTGTVAGLAGREDAPDVWYIFSSPLAPTTVYRYDPATKLSAPFEAAPPPVDVSQYETIAGFATSKDGTRVPYFLTAKKNLPRDGNNPTMLYGYGGFSVTTLPTYRADVPAWLELGGVLGHRQHARRRGIRRGVAQGRDAREEAERLRRLHRRGRAPGAGEGHVAGEAGHDGRIERRTAGGRGDEPAARSLRGGAARPSA